MSVRAGDIVIWAAFLGTAVGAAAGVGLLLAEAPLYLAIPLLVLLCGLVAALFHSRAGRLRTLLRFLGAQAEQAEVLRRLPPLGNDAVGRAASGVNTILAATTDASVDAIDSSRLLAETQSELELNAALARKSTELEQRLGERELLFELLREAAEKTGMDEVLTSLAARLGTALRLREAAILVRDDGDFYLRAVHGFSEPDALLGRSIRKGEGVAGEVTDGVEPVLIRDVSAEPGYLAFWGHAEKSGSFAAVPIRHGEESLGILAVTRPASDPLRDVELRFLSAIAATVALAILRSRLVDELRDLSTHDELTGLANRRLLGERLEREIDRAQRYDADLAVLTLDIDHFKQLNDRFGHPVGDAVLRDISRLLEAGVRSVDTVARVGGEEFMILLPRTDGESAARVADKLRARVAAHDIAALGGQHQVTISLGVAVLDGHEGKSALIARSDRALYEAKHRGRDRVVVHLAAAAQPAA